MQYIIASWGVPSNWKVKYKLKLNDKEDDYKVCESTTTLSPLYEHYKPNKVVIIVNDTFPSQFSNGNYNEFLTNIEDNYRRELKERVGLKQPHILVIPTRGKFKTNNLTLSLDGNINDMFGYLYYKLINLFINDINNYNENENIDIILDITHGHNILTLTTYTHIKRILSILAFKYKIGLRVYISDPVTSEQKEASINKVEENYVKRDIPIEYLGKCGNCILVKTNNKGDIDSKITREPNYKEKNCFINSLNKGTNYKEKNCFINSLNKGTPLAMYLFYPNLKEMKEKIECIIKLYIDSVKISSDGNNIQINRELLLTQDFNNYILIYFLAYVLNKLNISHREEITLDEFKYAKENVYKDLPTNALINRAIKEIEELKIGNDWKYLSEINNKKIGDFDHQNFLAHAGLEYNVTQLKISNSQILLRYGENDKDRIKKALSS